MVYYYAGKNYAGSQLWAAHAARLLNITNMTNVPDSIRRLPNLRGEVLPVPSQPHLIGLQDELATARGRMIFRFALPALAARISVVPAQAQTAVEPHTVAYVLCVTNETKKLALAIPEIAKDAIVERAFGACRHEEASGRKLLSETGASAAAIDERFARVKKFIRLSAPDDIDRQRVNRIPR